MGTSAESLYLKTTTTSKQTYQMWWEINDQATVIQIVVNMVFEIMYDSHEIHRKKLGREIK